jgi:phosphoserine phosphatase RsbU/P
VTERPPDLAAVPPATTAAFHEALLEDSAEDLYENAPCAYLSTTPEGTIVKVNRTFVSWTGHDRDALIGRQFVDLLTTGGRMYHETHVRPMLHMQGTVGEIAFDVVRADGSLLPVLANSVLRTDENGTPTAIRTALFDASTRRAYERELLRARRAAEDAEDRARILATTLQQTLIPPDPPAIPGLDVAAGYRPAGFGDEVGGDFYDIFETADDCWAIVIGDVCGKGAEAAVITALARYTLRAAAARDRRPGTALVALNDALRRQHVDRFCTAVFATACVGPGARTASFHVASAGHELPVLMAADGGLTDLGPGGALLGVFERPAVRDLDLRLGPGDLVVLYTDGVVEGRRNGRFFGEEGLREVLRRSQGCDARTVVHRVIETAVEYQGGRTSDDIAVVAVGVPRLPSTTLDLADQVVDERLAARCG